MARASWFDESSEVPLIQEKVERLTSFTDAMADGVIDRDEIEGQQARLVDAMKEVEGDLTDELHEKVTNLMVELSAYNIMRLLHELQAARAKAMFGDSAGS